jgi:hypothetical protein
VEEKNRCVARSTAAKNKNKQTETPAGAGSAGISDIARLEIQRP